MKIELTKKMLEAMDVALDVAAASDGFDGGDFDGMDRQQFVYARTWVTQELGKLHASVPGHRPGRVPGHKIITGPGE